MTTESTFEMYENSSAPECIRVATVGNVDSGKSTLVGVLTRSVLDDGRGKARASVFAHKHEKVSGRTSSVATEMMGFTGESILPPPAGRVSRPELFMNVAKNCWRTVTFIDLCGHEIYLKTTVFGLTALMPDYAFVMVGANMGMQRMTREHIGLCTALQIPFAIIVTKIDIAPENVLQTTKEHIAKVLRQARKQAIYVEDEASAQQAAEELPHGKVTPVFYISSTTGQGLPLLQKLLRTVPLRTSCGKRSSALALPVQFANRDHRDASSSTPATESGSTAPVAAVSQPSRPPDAQGTAEMATQNSANMHPSENSSNGQSGEPMAEDIVPRTPSAPGTPQMGGQMAPGAGTNQAPPFPVFADVKTAAGTKGADAIVHTRPGEVAIDSVFSIEGIGVVVAGMVLRGVIPVGANMMLGPDKSGEFHPVIIRSIEVNYVQQPEAREGYSAAFAIRQKNLRGRITGRDGRKKQWIRRGMSLVAPQLNPIPHWTFEAEIIVLHHQTTIMQGYVPVVHVGVVTQSALIESIRNKDGEEIRTIRTGDRAVVRFRWCYQAEYIHVDSPVLFREGRCKGVGRILRVSDPVGSVNHRNPAAGSTTSAPGTGRHGRRNSLLQGGSEISSVSTGP